MFFEPGLGLVSGWSGVKLELTCPQTCGALSDVKRLDGYGREGTKRRRYQAPVPARNALQALILITKIAQASLRIRW